MHEDTVYEYDIEDAMLTVNHNITFEQGIYQIEDILGDEADHYDITEAADAFYTEYGYADFRTIYYVDPPAFYDILAPYMKEEYANL